jgi:ABC-2 type transport system permease protein
MWSICIKELKQFFSSLTGFLAIIVFLLLAGLYLFVFPGSNVLDGGYATLDSFFDVAPWILLLLIPAITMRSFSEEFKGGTYEILVTRPLSRWQIILGKYFSALLIMLFALLPTLLYIWVLRSLSTGELDTGSIMGSYVGLFFLAATFTAIGICCSSFTHNAVVAFILSAFACFVVYNVFTAISNLPVFQSGADYYISLFGLEQHYRSMSRGVIDSRDVIYFLSVIILFLYITERNLAKR